VEYPFVRGLDEHPEIIGDCQAGARDRVNFGGNLALRHHVSRPAPDGHDAGAREIPPSGVVTPCTANMYAAYEALSPALQAVLRSTAMGSTAPRLPTSAKNARRPIRDGGTQEEPKLYEASHPVVRTHPETGRKALVRERRPHRPLRRA